jgi:hypothetical protein
VGADEVSLQMLVRSKEGLVYNATPKIKIQGQELIMMPDTVKAQNLILNFNVILITFEDDFLYLFWSQQHKKTCLRLLRHSFQKLSKMYYRKLMGC